MCSSNSISILLVEDNEILRQGIEEYLRLQSYDVLSVENGIEAFRVLAAQRFTVAIIDLGLPDIDGAEIVTFLRNHTETIIIVLTANNSSSTRIGSYQHGADLFMSKPIEAEELHAAITSLTSRRNALTATITPKTAEWRCNTTLRSLTPPDGVEVRFSTKEFQLLHLLLEHQGDLVTRSHICNTLYQRDDSSAYAALATLIKRTRQRLRTSNNCELPIVTSHGVGYSFGAKAIVLK